MSPQANISPEAWLIRLFGFERGGENSHLWQNPQSFSNNHMSDFRNWKSTKRSFSPEEILRCSWLYIRNQGASIFLRCYDNNRSVTGWDLFNRDRTFQGTWLLYRGHIGEVLRITLDNQFALELVANRDSLIHSGIRSLRGQAAPAYCKLVQLR